MSRLARWLFVLAAGTCGLATLAVAALWGRSCDPPDVLMYEDDRGYVTLLSAAGVLSFAGEFGAPNDYTGPTNWHYEHADFDYESDIEPRWYWFIERYVEGPGIRMQIVCPHWAVLAPLLLINAAVVWGSVVRWRRRRRAGCCAKCGYNLTGNVSGVCPECGTPTPAATARPPAPVEPRP